jgi:hypothetical protein
MSDSMIKLWLLSTILFSSSIAAQQPESEDIVPPQVYQHVVAIEDMLERISFEMGIRKVEVDTIGVSGVSSREVYFQAATLHTKTAQLMFEFTSKEGEVIDEHKLNATPSDVLSLLTGARQHLIPVLQALHVAWSKPLPSIDKSARPKEVFQLIVQLNKMTNQLLDFKFSPAQAHQKVTESIALASAILQTYSDATAVFFPTTRVSGKTPHEVYQQLVYLYGDLGDVFEKFGKSCLALEDTETQRQNVEPSDVYDLAVLVASQLRHFHALLPEKPDIKPSYYPGKVVPSDVYQRLGILQQQINELKRVNNIDVQVN